MGVHVLATWHQLGQLGLEEPPPRWLVCLYVWRHSVLGLGLLPHMAFLPPGPLLHMAWASPTKLVSESSLFLHGSWFPKGRKQKLAGHFRATPGSGTLPLPPYSLGQSSQRPCLDLRGREVNSTCDGGSVRVTLRKKTSAYGRYCWSHLRKIESSKGGEMMTLVNSV